MKNGAQKGGPKGFKKWSKMIKKFRMKKKNVSYIIAGLYSQGFVGLHYVKK